MTVDGCVHGVLVLDCRQCMLAVLEQRDMLLQMQSAPAAGTPSKDRLCAPGKWEGVSDGEKWTLEISYDCFSHDEPFVVDMWINFDRPKNAGQEWSDSGVFLSPEQAREVAAYLLVQADNAEANNRRVAESENRVKP